MGTRPATDDGERDDQARVMTPDKDAASAAAAASLSSHRSNSSRALHASPAVKSRSARGLVDGLPRSATDRRTTVGVMQCHPSPANRAQCASAGAGRVASERVGGRRRAGTTDPTHLRSSLPPTLSSAVVLDRRLLQKYEQVNHAIERIVRASQMDNEVAAASDAVSAHQVKQELRQVKKSSAQMIHAQKELLDKMERQERGGFRRVFTINKAAKMAKLKSKLCAKLSESVLVDEELQRLERQSTALSATTLGTITQNGKAVVNVSNVHGTGSNLFAASASHFVNTNSNISRVSATGRSLLDDMRDVSGSESSGPVPTLLLSSGWEDAQEELLMLEREKEDILNNLFQAVDMPAVLDLHARIASFSSEIKAVTSVKKQADHIEAMYRKALHLLRVALAAVVSPNYSGGIREFAVSSYPLAVEAGQLIEQACNTVQPEARRKYESFASELTHVRPPKFPQPVSDFARRTRTHYDPHSALSIEGMRNLHAAENVLILMQRLVIQKLESIEKWQTKLNKDKEAAERAHAQMESRLQEQMAVLARSVSA
ncbi:unnamed protein product [Hyaloperonospora brassicae]|uniref:Nucleoporin Nup54 alpha-helical domain-containing protein n=1 Tax=Hyaloperonospora brassicae TaxID=162125 RepID=A0AAV0TNJ2_HYABA|nr:unnamed protein product [Hyaloperonospora brassicae]